MGLGIDHCLHDNADTALIARQLDTDWLVPSLTICCRKGFQHVLHTSNQLIHLIQQAGPDATLDMDNVLLRQSLDVIGRVGFQQDMGGTTSLDSTSSAGHCLAVTTAAMAEVEKRFREPFRKRKFWRKVRALLTCLHLACHPGVAITVSV